MTTAPPALVEAFHNRFRLDRELGHGGMATVYLAHDLQTDTAVALKVIRLELSSLLGAERFAREIRITASLQHPNILPVLKSGEVNGFPYYTTPYIEGDSLERRLEREGALPLSTGAPLDRRVRWMSGNPNVATVTDSGRVHASSAGHVFIIATTEDREGRAGITVTDPSSVGGSPTDREPPFTNPARAFQPSVLDVSGDWLVELFGKSSGHRRGSLRLTQRDTSVSGQLRLSDGTGTVTGSIFQDTLRLRREPPGPVGPKRAQVYTLVWTGRHFKGPS